AQVGLRRVMSKKEADKVLRILRAPEVAVDLQPWNRRFRAYTEMLKSGSPYEIAKVLRDMYRLKFDKNLSFGERRLLDQAKSLRQHQARKTPASGGERNKTLAPRPSKLSSSSSNDLRRSPKIPGRRSLPPLPPAPAPPPDSLVPHQEGRAPNWAAHGRALLSA